MSEGQRRHKALAYAARDLIAADLARTLTIEELARACECSPTVLKEAFREEFGAPIRAWQRRRRMIIAARALVNTTLTVGEVARSVGYASPSKFSRAFTEELGFAPREWRERCKALYERSRQRNKLQA